MTGFLASVTNVGEARIALEAGVDIVDLKNPVRGALGALPIAIIEEIVHFVDRRAPISATVGDLPMQPTILSDAIAATAATGVDIVKIGFFGRTGHAECARSLALITRSEKIVAVMFADQKPDFTLLPLLADSGFYGVMLDTADKTAGGLRSWLSKDDLQDFVSAAHIHRLLTGLAGSLRKADVPLLASLGADYLGFRGALCTNDERKSMLDPARVIAIRKAVAKTQQSRVLDTEIIAMPYCHAYSSS
jgi:uncharacterized protein (UPF0264 family)